MIHKQSHILPFKLNIQSDFPTTKVHWLGSIWFTPGCGNLRAYWEGKTQMHLLHKVESYTRCHTYQQAVFLHFRQTCILKLRKVPDSPQQRAHLRAGVFLKMGVDGLQAQQAEEQLLGLEHLPTREDSSRGMLPTHGGIAAATSLWVSQESGAAFWPEKKHHHQFNLTSDVEIGVNWWEDVEAGNKGKRKEWGNWEPGESGRSAKPSEKTLGFARMSWTSWHRGQKTKRELPITS